MKHFGRQIFCPSQEFAQQICETKSLSKLKTIKYDDDSHKSLIAPGISSGCKQQDVPLKLPLKSRFLQKSCFACVSLQLICSSPTDCERM